jgi:uncharacterized protein
MRSMQSESTITVERELSGDSGGAVTPIGNEIRSPFAGFKVVSLKIWNWMSPVRVWRELKLAETARRDFAAGLAIGVFIACVPLYGFQTVLSLFAARRFSLHPLPILAGSQLSAPPFAPALAVASVALGQAAISGKLPHLADWHFHHWPAFSMAAMNSFVVSWLIGGAVLGVLLAMITYMIAFTMMKLVFRNRPVSAEIEAA